MRRRGDGVGAEDYGRGRAEMGQGSGGPWWALAGPRRITAGLKTRIESIDYDKRTITFKNRKGVLTTYKFGKDAKRFDEVRRGDMLVIDYKETVAVSVK